MAAASLVLAVDDEPAVLNVLERILQREGYAVETAVNGVGQARCRCTGAVEKTSGNAKMRGFLPT